MSEDVKIKYDEIKKKKTHRYCVFFIKDEKLIAVEKIGKLELGIYYFQKWGMILVFKTLFQEAYVVCLSLFAPKNRYKFSEVCLLEY